jgi:hypothetical protein
MPRHRHQEFIPCLKKIDAQTPTRLDLHRIVDNEGPHKDPRVKSWLQRRPRCHFHFIPAFSFCLNLVEGWFRDLADKPIRRGSFQDVPGLIAGIHGDLNQQNQKPNVLIWSVPVERILPKGAKCPEA